MRFEIRFAHDPAGLERLAAVLRRYVHEQGWADEPAHLQEISTLPGEYAPPQGALLIAVDEVGHTVGCVVLRPLAQWCDECVEMRRLYVVPEARRLGAARALIDASERWAREAGYARMRLVTLPYMTEAIALYGGLGFSVVERYRPSTAEDAIFMDKPLG